MKLGSNTSIPERMAEMSIPELIRTILVLLALITVLVLIALLIGQHADEEIGWIVWLGSLGYNVVDESECSVLLAEQPSKRSLRERLFGTGTDED